MRRGPFRFIRVRLTLWYVLLLGIMLAAFSAGVYAALRQSLNENLNNTLDNRAETMIALATRNGGAPGASDLDIAGDTLEGESYARLFDQAGKIVFDNSPPEFSVPPDMAAVTAALSGEEARRHVKIQGDDFRVLTLAVTSDSGIVGAAEVGMSEGDVRDTLRLLILIIAVAYPMTLIVASAGGVFLAGRALGPIDRLTRVTRAITAEDLSQRLDLSLPDDEIGRLARTFNEMIARLDEAFRRQRQFTADASHELRTPLTAVKGQIEVALQRDRDPEGYRAVLNAVNAEVDRMARLVGSLLALARAGAGQIPIARDQVNIGDVVTDTVDQLRPAAEAKGVALELRPGPAVSLVADQDLLLQLMLNLLDNAVKYTPAGGSIRVSWNQADGLALLEVADTGPGIAPEHLPHIFDPFYRVDLARSRADGGAGLGLSICRWIAEAHGGSIEAESTVGDGSAFIVRLPLP